MASDVPIAESTEYRPPTQSQNPKALSGSMPKAATLARAVETATKWRETASCRASSVSSIEPEATRASQSHARANRALTRVSSVPKVLDATMSRVVAETIAD